MITDFKKKIYDAIGEDSYQSWFVTAPVRIFSPCFGVVVIEATSEYRSNFYRNWITKNFGDKLHSIAKELEYERLFIVSSHENNEELKVLEHKRKDFDPS